MYAADVAVAVCCRCLLSLFADAVVDAVAGAAGVGVGSAINQLNSEIAMIAAVRSLVESLATVNTRIFA